MIRKATVEGGVVKGIPAADPRITAFKGIPFAAPPVGENRWRAPQPVIPWEGELDCLTFKPISMQHIPGLDKDNIYSREWNVDPEIPMDEDCLYLNVWTPAKSPDEKLPVYVWFFGGGLKEGNPAEMEFDGERLARRGIVVVTLNYRLNCFGFLAHPQLTKEQPDAPSNFGHLDQQAGVRWAKKNIAAFGGDPDNITIGGQSAGGGSVCAQLTSPQNEGLFQRAIIQSGIMAGVYGTFFPGAKNTFAAAEEQGERFFEFLGVKTLEEARKIDAVTLRDKCEEFGAMFGTTQDGVFQTGDANTNIMKGNNWRVPLMITRTEDEFAMGLMSMDKDDFKAKAVDIFGDDAEEFLRICSGEHGEAVKKSFANGLEIAIRSLATQRKALGIDDPIYYAIFDAEIPGWDNPGTFHSVDLWFYFETLAKCWRPFVGKHYDLSRKMCNYWANFIRSGNPNGDDADGTPMPEWKPFTEAEPNLLRWEDDVRATVEGPDALHALLSKTYLKKNINK
ncbi:MAG: carboxylesterase family protein [Oscillospiraceae bacterium]|nr:carboxylesterase family protein [Oscillospiraceae bacterium]